MMKNFVLLCVFMLSFSLVSAQNNLPNLKFKDLDGKTVSINELSKDKTIVISLWATWCVNCIKELDAISDLYEDWQDETGVELIAVTVDDSRGIPKVKPLVNGKGWEYQVLFDPNSDLKRALGAATIPLTVIVKNNKVVYKHSGYTPGAEDDLYEEIKKHTK